MPVTSKAQMRFMQAAAHSPKFAKKAGIKGTVAQKFVDETPKGAKLPARAKKKK